MRQSTIGKKYGWKPDLPDHRDKLYAAGRPLLVELPPRIDLREKCPPVYEQGELSSCTANAIGAAHQFNQIKEKPEVAFAPSRLFIYFNERVMEDSVTEDAGAMIRDGIKSVADKGVCPESEWPYVIDKFAVKPSDACYEHAMNHQSLDYRRINHDLQEMKNCLYEGYPFAFGFSVYENFEGADVAQTGIMHMPQGSMIGGHAVLTVGYDDDRKSFIVRNSWGVGWGDKGYFYMPYKYIVNPNLADDFWTIRNVEV